MRGREEFRKSKKEKQRQRERGRGEKEIKSDRKI